MGDKKSEPAYTYAAIILKWVDGDTFDAKILTGFHMSFEGRFRLYGVDTPERGQELHDEAHHRAEELAPAGSAVTVSTHKAPDKYGRWLAEVHLANGRTVNDVLNTEGLSYTYFGGTKTTAAKTD